jgi:hypothetical protein
VYAPVIRSAVKAGETVLSNGLIAVSLTNVENDPTSPVEYGHLLVLFACGVRDPVAFIASELSREGQWLLCRFTASGHGNYGEVARIASLSDFQPVAIDLAERLCEQGLISPPAIAAKPASQTLRSEDVALTPAPRGAGDGRPSKAINLALLGVPMDFLDKILGEAIDEVGNDAPIEVTNQVLARKLLAHGIPEARISAYLAQFLDSPAAPAPPARKPGLLSRIFGTRS